MKPAYTTADLHAEIAALEARRKEQEEGLKQTAGAAFSSIKPANLIKNTFSATVASPGFGKNVLKGAAALAIGFLSKKFLLRSSANIAKKALGTLVEIGVAKAVAGNASKLKSGGIKLLRKLLP